MVVDISTFDTTSFGPSDVFFLDTNIILYLHYPPYNSAYKAVIYSNFIAGLQKSGCSLRVSSFNVQEAFHVIETLELNSYNSKQSTPLSRKSFRNKYRSYIGTQASALWSQIKSNYQIENAIINRDMLDEFINNYTHYRYDPIDYLLTANHPTCNIISSDYDFSSDPAISVYTYQTGR